MDIFYPYKNHLDTMIVDVTDMSMETLTINDSGTQYTLTWKPQYSYYSGTINGIAGYVM